MRILVYDTETTGFKTSDPLDHVSQPHCVQLCAKIFDIRSMTIEETFNCYSKPIGWRIGRGATAVHGITNEFASKNGIYEGDVLEAFNDMESRVDVTTAFKIAYDDHIVSVLRARYSKGVNYVPSARFCLMEVVKPICKVPPTARMRAAGRFGYKTPNLSEAYKIFTGEKLSGAHDAEVDVDGTIAILRKLLEAEQFHNYITNVVQQHARRTNSHAVQA